MIRISDIKKNDKLGMYRIYDKWPEIAQRSYNLKLSGIKFTDVNHIIFSGMGGSGTIGDFFAAILSKTDVHVNVVKGYTLPKNANSKTLVIITSVSGNTIESLTVLDLAFKKNCKILAFSSGGKIEKICKKNKIDYFKIKQYNSPRASFVSFVYTILKILESNIPVKKLEILDSIKELKKTRDNICSRNLSYTNESLNLANSIKSIPVIYYPFGLQAAAIRFKSSLQENCKTHAIVEDVIEASHNGIVAWEKKSKTQPILLQGKEDYIKTKHRWKVFEKYFKTNNIKFEKIISKEGNIITKLINLIYVLDYCSIYLAVSKGIDPTPVKSVEYLKKNIEK